MSRKRARAIARSLRGPAIVLAAYAILRLVFDRASRDGGLITPDGGVSFAVAGLGVLTLVMRLAAVFAVPAIVVYRVIRGLLAAPAPHTASASPRLAPGERRL